MPTISLEQIEVPQPCRVSWSRMRGNGSARFCEYCQKHVYDLSTMPRDRAEQLVCQSGGELCVRMTRAVDGTVLTLDYQTLKGRKKWSWRAWTLFALCAALITGVVNAAFFGNRVFIMTRVAGGMSCRLPTPTGPYAPTYNPPPPTSQGNDPADDFEL